MTEQPSFSVTVLEQLRAGSYRPGAWLGMLSASWMQARVTAGKHPDLVYDWWRLATTLGTATLGFVAYTAHRHGKSVVCKSAIPLMLATLLQSGDQYVHLGLHRQETGELYPRLGPAMTLTALRGWVGIGIGSRWLVGTPITDDEALVGLTMMLVSDIADGWLARRHNFSSALGRYLDGEADAIAWTTLTLTQVQHHWIPAWFLGVHGLRWGLPVALGFSRTFATARPVPLSRSWMGRVAGLSQALVAATAICSSLRRDKPDAQFWRRIQKNLLTGTCAVLAMTTIQHIASILRPFQGIQASGMVSL
jgi:phosphatidylglycerophosphate synthase